MKKHFWILFGLVVAFNFFLGGCKTGDPSGSNLGYPYNWRNISIEMKAQAFTANLEAQGFEVIRGFPYIFGIDQCQYAIETMGNCYANNPLAPYIAFALPPWPGQFVDPGTLKAFGLVPDGYNAIYRFDPREAVVILAFLPPPAGYFGLQTYEFTREGTINTGDPIYQMLASKFPSVLSMFFGYSPNPKRIVMLASIGNSINNTIIQKQSGKSFDAERFFILTPDQFMERKLKEALLQTATPSQNDIFVEPVSQALTLGLNESAYDFSTLIRYAAPDNEDAAEGWRNDLPLVVLRVRDPNAARPVETYPPPVLDSKGGVSEHYLQTDLQNLVAAVKQKWGQAGAVDKSLLNMQLLVDLVGPHCDIRGMNCLGDTQDTSYQSTLNLSIDDNQFYAVVGPLATQTGNATYVNLSVYNAPIITGLYSVLPSELPGTAQEFSPTVNNTGKFFIYYFARDCSALAFKPNNCFSIPETMIPKGVPIKIIQRNYVVPGTERGADPNLLLMPIFIQMTSP